MRPLSDPDAGRAEISVRPRTVGDLPRLVEIPCLDVVQRHSVAKAIYEKRGWVAVGQTRPPWLPEDEPPVIAMILPTGGGHPTPV